MTVADEAAGRAEAQRRIAACRETRGEDLDLGGLQLTRVPEEVYELRWLRRLYLGADPEARNDRDFGGYDENDRKRCNALGALTGALCKALAGLELLDLAHNGLKALPTEMAGLVNLLPQPLGQ
jgi:internalin A